MAVKPTRKTEPPPKRRFGRPIQFKSFPRPNKPDKPNKHGANAMVSQFLNVKKNYGPRLAEMTKGDIHAHRFYCGDDCAFIFDLSVMETLINAVKDPYIGENKPKPGDAFVVLFQGLKKTKDAGKFKGCPFGLPTLIATVYVEDEKGDFKHIRIKKDHLSKTLSTSADDPPPPFDGFQHPGNGNSGEEFPIEKIEGFEKPPKVVKRSDNDEDETDFIISDTIDSKVVQNWIKE